MGITVRVGYMPGTIQEVAVSSGAKVSEVLSVAGMESSGYDIRVNSETATTSTTVSHRHLYCLLSKSNRINASEGCTAPHTQVKVIV